MRFCQKSIKNIKFDDFSAQKRSFSWGCRRWGAVVPDGGSQATSPKTPQTATLGREGAVFAAFQGRIAPVTP